MHNRRKFVKDSSLAISCLPFFDFLGRPSCSSTKRLKLEIYATNWGFDGTMDEFCAKAKSDGYAGIEVWTPQSAEKTLEVQKALDKYDLRLGLLVGNWGKTFTENLNSFKQSVDRAIALQPEFINCHSGKDFYSVDLNSNFLIHSFEKSGKSGIPIYHETHRGRMLYSAPVTKKFIQDFEELELTLDISHWCCVHESLLSDQEETVNLALKRIGHIHSRVGFPESPQIPDPNSNQFKEAVEAHFAWWDKVVSMKSERGDILTMTTEFGPPPYMWTHPTSGRPLADNWDINVAMKKLWIDRYVKKA